FKLGEAGGIAAWPRQARDHAGANRVDGLRKHDGHEAAGLLRPPRYFGSPAQYDIRFEREQFSRLSAVALGIALAPTIVDPQVTPDGPAKFLQPLNKRGKPRLGSRIVGSHIHEHADSPHPLGLLGAGRDRPRRHRAAEQRDELAPPDHSITSSA